MSVAKKKKILIIAAVIGALLLISLFYLWLYTPVSQTPDAPDIATPQEIPHEYPDFYHASDDQVNASDFESPWYPECRPYARLVPVRQTGLVIDSHRIYSNRSPYCQQVLSSVDISDTIFFAFTPAPGSIVPQETCLILASHDVLQDPYKTSEADIQGVITKTKLYQDETEWKATVTFPEFNAVNELVDVFLVQDGKITYYTMLYVTKNSNSLMYFQNQYPQENISSFQIVAGQHAFEYYFCVDEAPTFAQWIQTAFNTDDITQQTIGFCYNDEWVVPTAIAEIKLTSGMKIPATVLKQSDVVDITSPQYPAFLIGKGKEYAEFFLGEPNVVFTNIDSVSWYYDDFELIIQQSEVVQINMIDLARIPAHRFPPTTTLDALTTHLSAYNINMPMARPCEHPHTLCFTLPIQDIYITYVIAEDLQTITDVIIHKDETYKIYE